MSIGANSRVLDGAVMTAEVGAELMVGMDEVMGRYTKALGAHRDDTVVDSHGRSPHATPGDLGIQ